MLIVIVDFTVAPENMGISLQALQVEMPIARALPGNIMYSIWTDPNQMGRLRLVQEWEDSSSFDGYRASDGFKTVGGILRPLMLGQPSSRVFDATLISPTT
jgi:quinol monooxygenase YgiN